MSQTHEALHTLTLRELHSALIQRGVDVSYSTLSEFVATGDIATQLQAGGGANRREFRPETAEILAAFWPIFREAGGRKPNAPALLRRFLASSSPVSETGELTTARGNSALSETPKLPPDLMERLAAALESHARALERSPAQPDRLLVVADVQHLVPMSAGWLRANVPTVTLGRRRFWRQSDVFRFIADLAA